MSSVRRPSLRRRLANPKAADARTGATRPALAFTSSRIIHFRSALNHALLPPLRASTLRQPGFVRYLSPNVTHRTRTQQPGLGDFVHVRKGFITGANTVFVLDNVKIPEGEGEIYMPYLPDRDMRRYAVPEHTSKARDSLKLLRGPRILLVEIRDVPNATMPGHNRVTTANDAPGYRFGNLQRRLDGCVGHMINVDDHALFHHCLNGVLAQRGQSTRRPNIHVALGIRVTGASARAIRRSWRRRSAGWRREPCGDPK